MYILPNFGKQENKNVNPIGRAAIAVVLEYIITE